MSEMPELLPCPFCGTKCDELMVFCDPQEALDNSGHSRRIQCSCCNVEAPFYDSEAEAVAAWNRRADPYPEAHPDARDSAMFEAGKNSILPEIEALRRELDEARAALRLALPVVEAEREGLVECCSLLERHGEDFRPIPGTLDPIVADEVASLDSIIATCRAALAVVREGEG